MPWRTRPETDVVGLLLETLRLEGERSDDLALSDAWGARGATPHGLAGLIDFEGCALWLARRLRQIGADAALESEFGRAMTQLARGIAARNLLIDAETETVLRHVAARDIPCILMKGAARRALVARLPFADARPMLDLDILVPNDAAPELWDYLRAQGYALVHPGRGPRPLHHHLPGVIGPAGVAVEIHTSVAPGVPAGDTWRRLHATATPVQRFGVWTLVPSITELLWDALMHALHNGARGFRLHHLLAATAIVAARDEAALRETRARLARLPSRDMPWPALASAWLDAATWLGGLGNGTPPAILQRALHWRLALVRRLPRAYGSDHKTLGAFADEASRIEFDLPPTRGIQQGLRPLGAALIRNAYRCWRLAAS
jgi:hypothetical protein